MRLGTFRIRLSLGLNFGRTSNRGLRVWTIGCSMLATRKRRQLPAAGSKPVYEVPLCTHARRMYCLPFLLSPQGVRVDDAVAYFPLFWTHRSVIKFAR